MDTYITIIVVLVVIFAELYIEAFAKNITIIIKAWRMSERSDTENVEGVNTSENLNTSQEKPISGVS